MRNRSNQRLAVALLFFLLTLVASSMVVDRAQAQTPCYRCGVCNEGGGIIYPCCKQKLPGGVGRTECDSGDYQFPYCTLSGNPC